MENTQQDAKVPRIIIEKAQNKTHNKSFDLSSFTYKNKTQDGSNIHENTQRRYSNTRNKMLSHYNSAVIKSLRNPKMS